MFPKGKGWYIWKIIETEGGDNEAIAHLAAVSELGHLLIKIADGIGKYNISANIADLVSRVHAKGIQVWGWHYIYGKYPKEEGLLGAQLVKQYDLDGYVADVEKEYKFLNSYRAADIFCQNLNAQLKGSVPTAISSYRYPKYHLEIPWSTFLSGLDFNMPQVYWLQATNPAYQLNRCIQEFSTITPVKPIVPTGAAFRENWEPTIGQIKEFMDTALALNLPAINFWEWRNCRAYLPDIFEFIAQYSWPVDEPPPPPPELTDKEKLDILWNAYLNG